MQLLPCLDKRGENRDHQDKEGSGSPLPLVLRRGGSMSHGGSVGGGGDDSGEGERVVSVMRIKLDVVVRHDSDCIEWKCTGITGEPARMSSLLAGRVRTTDTPEKNAGVMLQAVRMLLEEYQEPF
jgi:hypothetical protein